MADITANTTTQSASFSLSKLGNWIWNGLIFMGENSAMARKIEALSQVSDEELTARGTTRRDETIRILGGYTHL